jgi:hypothetical protein
MERPERLPVHRLIQPRPEWLTVEETLRVNDLVMKRVHEVVGGEEAFTHLMNTLSPILKSRINERISVICATIQMRYCPEAIGLQAVAFVAKGLSEAGQEINLFEGDNDKDLVVEAERIIRGRLEPLRTDPIHFTNYAINKVVQNMPELLTSLAGAGDVLVENAKIRMKQRRERTDHAKAGVQ